jgi:nucleoside-diphosphate-sugar epimerase
MRMMRNLAEWIMTIAHHASPEYPVYNVGSDQVVLMDDLAKFVAKEFGVDVRILDIKPKNGF